MFDRQEKEFSSAEHRFLGEITLKGLPANFNKFKFPSGTEITFGEIIALAGDYFGVYLEPIALGATDDIRRERFLDAYAELKSCDPETIYNITQDISYDHEDNKILVRDINKHVIRLALHNIDHFDDYATSAFATGYQLAMEAAVHAGHEADPQRQQEELAYAYTLLAYACHFLTDRFAAGHVRVPRMQLDQLFSPEIGSLMSFFQHNEDGDMGLELQSATVNSAEVTPFMGFGDGHLFQVRNNACRERVKSAVQAVADEIYQAFSTKQVIHFEDSVVNRLIPYPTANNHFPLFKMGDEGKLQCRFWVTKPYTDHYVEMNTARAVKILIAKGAEYAGTAIGEQITKAVRCLKGEKMIDDGKVVDQSIFSPRVDGKDENPVLVNVSANLLNQN